MWLLKIYWPRGLVLFNDDFLWEEICFQMFVFRLKIGKCLMKTFWKNIHLDGKEFFQKISEKNIESNFNFTSSIKWETKTLYFPEFELSDWSFYCLHIMKSSFEVFLIAPLRNLKFSEVKGARKARILGWPFICMQGHRKVWNSGGRGVRNSINSRSKILGGTAVLYLF